MPKLGLTPSQTVGPFFSFGLTPGAYGVREIFSNDLRVSGAAGAPIRIEGRVLDGDGAPIKDAMIEIWQADGEGRYAHPADARPRGNTAFKGFGRIEPDANGAFAFLTVKPGRVPGPGGKPQAPHINVTVFARGLLTHLRTRIYFADEADNAGDPVLALVPADRRATLIAAKITGAKPCYRFDIRLQGEGETVFFQC
jgi:protocatechuate 3,4-dioxygenase, alpha subunit